MVSLGSIALKTSTRPDLRPPFWLIWSAASVLTCRVFSLVDTLPETNNSPLQNGGSETILSFWGPAYFQGPTVIVLGRVVQVIRKRSVVYKCMRKVNC